jgi:hypothetical protein
LIVAAGIVEVAVASVTFMVSVPAPPSITSAICRVVLLGVVPRSRTALMVSLPEVPATLSIPVVSEPA